MSRATLAVEVLRLRILGFFLAFKAGGLIKEGEDGSDVNVSKVGRRLSARLLGFLGFLGEGEVIGRSTVSGAGLSNSPIFRL